MACIATLLMLGATPSLAQQPAAPPPPTSGAGIIDSASSAYVLGRDDVVEVGLLGRTDFGGRARVQADGTIQLPFIGKVQAADRTTSELSDTVRNALKAGGYFSDPIVTVEVVGYASRYVVVLGAVGSPGLVPINRPYRLSEILARVGGVRDNAADFVIVRSDKGEEKRMLVAKIYGGGPDEDPYVQPGDKIYAPPADTYYIYGKVNSPGAFTLSGGMTARQAIARAGGLGESGSDKKIDVTRGGKKLKLKLDDPVLPGDVLVVGERLF
jgi:polysaccharide export outer membrane protein